MHGLDKGDGALLAGGHKEVVIHEAEEHAVARRGKVAQMRVLHMAVEKAAQDGRQDRPLRDALLLHVEALANLPRDDPSQSAQGALAAVRRCYVWTLTRLAVMCSRRMGRMVPRSSSRIDA
jgi:hypothetical protein